MTTKKKAAPGRTGTASNTAFDNSNHTAPDPLIGWFNLAKPSRSRQMKRSWKRSNQRGRIDACLLAQLAMLAAVVLLIVRGLAYA
jgi:hypothetical protein